MNKLSYVLTLAIMCSAPFAEAAFTFLGPSPYLSAADSPFDLSGLGSTFFLEDFEDLVPQPGISGDPILNGAPLLEFIQQIGNSVDGDDGVIDGSGSRGFSAGRIESTDGAMTTEIIRFQFEPLELGFWPTAVGLVLTHGAGITSDFTVFSTEGGVATLNTNDLAISAGPTSDDRFIGVLNPAGIVKIEFRKSGFAATGPLVDHLQYGLLIPEPSAIWIVVVCLPILRAIRKN